MRIALLTSYFYHEVAELHGKDRIIFGGAERYLVELCRFLQQEGHQVAVYQPLNNVVRDVNGELKQAACGQLSKEYAGIPIICLPNTGEQWAYSTNSGLNLVFNEIATFFDLRIYFATFLCWPQVVLPAISISHGIFWDYPQHFVRTWSEDERKEFFRRQLYGFNTPDVCVAVDSNVRKVLAALEPGSEQRVHVVYNFVDTGQFQPAPKKWEGINILYPRRLTQLRGCNEFIKASRQYPEYNYLAVGQAGDEALEQRVAAWADTTPHLRFIFKPMEEMAEIYQQADISVVPTKSCEGLSLSLLESMACGLPVVTTPVGGLGDGVIDGYNALVYDPNHDNLGDYIDLLARDEEMRRRFGERNRQIACECFDLKIWHGEWRKILNSFC